MAEHYYRVEHLMAEVERALERRGPWTPVVVLTPRDLQFADAAGDHALPWEIQDHEDLGKGRWLGERLSIFMQQVIRKLVKPYFRYSLRQINEFHARLLRSEELLQLRQDRLESDLHAYLQQIDEQLGQLQRQVEELAARDRRP